MSKKIILWISSIAVLVLVLVLLALSGCGDSSKSDHGDDTKTHGAEKHHEDTAQDKSVAKPYPFEKCLVSGDKLGSMGDPIVLVHEGQQIKFCCKGCIKDFKKEPEKFLKILQESGPKEEKSESSGHDHGSHDH